MNKIKENLVSAVKDFPREKMTKNEVIEIVETVIPENRNSLITDNGIELNRADMRISYNGKTKVLRNLEFELMRYFIENKNHVIERRELIKNVWGSNVSVETRTIDVCVCNLRKIIGKEKIITSKNVGFRYVND